MRTTVEREAKLGAWSGFALPSLDGVVEGVLAGARPEFVLDASYYDTADLRLARSGVTVRHRSGGGEDGWTVKLPAGSEGSATTRHELAFPGGPRAVPAPVSTLVRGLARGEALGLVSTLRTRRRVTELRDGDGAVVAEVDDDEVTVLEGRRVAARCR